MGIIINKFRDERAYAELETSLNMTSTACPVQSVRMWRKRQK